MQLQLLWTFGGWTKVLKSLSFSVSPLLSLSLCFRDKQTPFKSSIKGAVILEHVQWKFGRVKLNLNVWVYTQIHPIAATFTGMERWCKNWVIFNEKKQCSCSETDLQFTFAIEVSLSVLIFCLFISRKLVTNSFMCKAQKWNCVRDDIGSASKCLFAYQKSAFPHVSSSSKE